MQAEVTALTSAARLIQIEGGTKGHILTDHKNSVQWIEKMRMVETHVPNSMPARAYYHWLWEVIKTSPPL